MNKSKNNKNKTNSNSNNNNKILVIYLGIFWTCLNHLWKNVANKKAKKVKEDVNFSKIWPNNLDNIPLNLNKWLNNSLILNFSKLLYLNKEINKKDSKISLNKWTNLLLNLKKWLNNLPTQNFSLQLLHLNNNNNNSKNLKNKKNNNNKMTNK